MRIPAALVLVAAWVSAAEAKAWITVYQGDGKTPLAAVDPNHPTVYRDIMVGTRLAFVVSSDTGVYWVGRVQLTGGNRNYAELQGRGPVTTLPSGVILNSYPESCLDAAGGRALATFTRDSTKTRFDLSTTASNPPSGVAPTVAGDWFVLDYRATQVGYCDVGLYTVYIENVLGSLTVPTQTLSFCHVPSRDFNTDTRVDFKDFAKLASHWGSVVNPPLAGGSPGPQAACDLNGDAQINFGDLALFSEYWLAQTDYRSPADDPNIAAPSP